MNDTPKPVTAETLRVLRQMRDDSALQIKHGCPFSESAGLLLHREHDALDAVIRMAEQMPVTADGVRVVPGPL